MNAEAETSASSYKPLDYAADPSDWKHIDRSKTPTKKKSNGEWDIPCEELADVQGDEIDPETRRGLLNGCYWRYHREEVVAGGCPPLIDWGVHTLPMRSGIRYECTERRQGFLEGKYTYKKVEKFNLNFDNLGSDGDEK